MPLVKLFVRSVTAATKAPPVVPLQKLQAQLCKIWGTTPATTKLMLMTCDDWTTATGQDEEDVYVDIRAYGKAERTREVVLEGMDQVQQAFAQHNLSANVRLETYEGERYFHLPAKVSEVG